MRTNRFLPLLGACAALLTGSAWPVDLEAQFQKGRALLRGETEVRNLPEALRLLKEAAEAGHAGAKGAYGYMLAKGMSVPMDEKTGLEWIRQSAEAGEPSAMLNFGIMTMRGQGTAADANAGLAWIRKAADLNHVEAQVRLAEIYYWGQNGIAASPEAAAPWAVRAAGTGHAWALNLTGTMKEHGRGLPMDPAGALTDYQNAARKGEPKAQASMGRMLFNGNAGPRDPVRAWYWLTASASQGEIMASRFLEETAAGFTMEEIAQAKALLEKEPPPGASRRPGPGSPVPR